ncbi:MAG: hypothetical protein IK078_05900, partial [Lachnospiraceae bacterium]|nr:hypothetical protein [Lachnospiraceae bacterium]
MLPYEELLKKGEPAPSAKGEISVLIGVLKSINEDSTSPLFGKLGDYANAVSMITRNSSYKSKKKPVTEALDTMKGFNDFLIDGKENTIYQDIINEATTKHGYSQEQVDKALDSFSTFVGMGLDLDKIKAKQNTLDEKNVGLKDDGKPLTNAVYFEKRTKAGKTFATHPTESKQVMALKDILTSASATIDDQINSYETKLRNHNTALTAADREAYEQNKALEKELKKYTEAITVLTAD